MILNFIYKIINFFFGIDLNQIIEKNVSSQLEIKDLLSQKKELESARESLIYRLDQNKTDYSNKENEFESKIKNIQGTLIKLQTEKSVLQSEYDDEKVQNTVKQNALEVEIRNLKNKIQTLTAEKTNSVNSLNDTDLSVENIKKENDSLNEQISKHENYVRILKEQISSQQAEITKADKNSKEIIRLQQTVQNAKAEIKDLKSEISILRISETETTHSVKSNHEAYQLADGIIIHKEKNTGERVKKEFEKEVAEFEYLDGFRFELVNDTKSDTTEFPDVFYPKKGVSVLKWHKLSQSETTGVSEPILAKALEELKNALPQIQILQNIGLSIMNRDYSYKPDIAVYWEEYNLLIDIEIDEPYDLVSRKPLHYQGSSDYLRNLYFISQGWVVIRFCEEQIVKNTDDCVKFVADILEKITGVKCITEAPKKKKSFLSKLNDAIADNLSDDHKSTEQIVKITRWTYEQAKELEQQKYREQYLNIDLNGIEDEDYQEFAIFDGVAPDFDILPVIDYSELESKFKSISTKYIRVTTTFFNHQFILENYQIEIQNYLPGISGFNPVDEKPEFVKFENILDIEGLDSIFKYPLYSRQHLNDDKIASLVEEAIYNFNPIRIEYKDGNANITFRNISLIDYNGRSESHFCDNIWKKYYEPKSSMIDAFCMLRSAHRQFYISRMNAIQVYDVKDVGMGHALSFSASLWYPLNHNDLKLCEHIISITPANVISSDIVYRGNYAHYLLLSGKTDEALKIYQTHVGEQITNEQNWTQINLLDFEELSSTNESYKPKFEEAKQLLGW